ncbi:MAG: hypothetical protein ABUL73_00545 [Alphaproteobacteria bacterium]
MAFRHAALPLLLAAAPGVAWAQSALPAPIESQALSQLDAWSVGALSQSQGALPNDMWAQSDPNFIGAVFDKLPASFASPAVGHLATRVLLSGATAPPGDAQAGARQRFQALGRLGFADPLANMASGTGPSLSDPAIAQFAAQAELARNNRAGACQRGRDAVTDTPGAFFVHLRAYCAAVTGDRSAADLALQVGGTDGNAADNAWYAAAVAAAGGAPGRTPPAARYGNSLDAQLSIAGSLRPGPNALTSASSLALVTLARNDQTPQPVRAQATALAFQRGLLSADNARAILHSTPADVTTGLPGIATALRQVEASPGTLDAATAIATVLRQATTPADFNAASLFFHNDIAALTTAPDPGATVLFVRAALASGDEQLATRLAQSARQAGIDASTMAPIEAALAVMERARGDQATQAVHRRIEAGGGAQTRAAARDVTLMAALGFTLDGWTQSFLIANPPQGGARADPGAMATLNSALERRAQGEAALLVVVAAGDGPAKLDAESAAYLIRVLRALSLDDEARRFAVEAILAGPPN